MANNNEITALKIDGVPIKDGFISGLGGYFLPGKHTISAGYSWVDMIPAGTILTPIRTNKPGIKTTCIDTKPGERYWIGTTQPHLKEWKILVYNNDKVVNYPCYK